MNDAKAFETNMAGGGGLRGVFADPLSLATKPPVIFKFASAVSIAETLSELHCRALRQSIPNFKLSVSIATLIGHLFLRFIRLVRRSMFVQPVQWNL